MESSGTVWLKSAEAKRSRQAGLPHLKTPVADNVSSPQERLRVEVGETANCLSFIVIFLIAVHCDY